MSTRIHTKIVTTIAAALVIAAVVAPGASAGPSKGTRITIPQSLARLQEPGSTGYVPKTTQVTNTGTAPQMRALILRAQALNRLYGNAWTRISPAEFKSLVKAFGGSVTTTMSLQQARAELARGKGLNRLPNVYRQGSTGYVPMSPRAPSSSAPKVDPLAVGYLMGHGYTPRQVHAWTVGGCSHRVKPAACFGPSRGANLTDDGATVDPFAVSYLMGQGLTPSEVRSWTVGACSQRVKAPSCYAMFKPAATSSAATSSTKEVIGSTGFQWRDAGVGAGFTLGIVLLLGAAGAGLLISRRNGGRRAARA